MSSFSDFMAVSLGGYSLGKILSAALTLIVCLLVTKLIIRALEKLVNRSKYTNDRLRRVTLNASKGVLYILTVIIVAGTIGINTSSLTAIASVLTLGITLATQDLMSNVAGGLVILSTRPFSVGDVIESDGTVGTVCEISLNHTKIETADGQIVLQPNSAISSAKITNYSVLGRRRIVISIGASYDAPTADVKAALYGAVSAVPGILDEPAPEVRLVSYGESAIEYSLRCWANVSDYWETYFALNEAVRESFAEHGIEIPYNHLNVHIVENSTVSG